jgi:uncharacterized membrane protein
MATGGMAKMGNSIAPPRFILFVVILIAGSVGGSFLWDWPHAFMTGFDAASFLFLLFCLPLLNDSAAQMRQHAAENDANRAGLLALTVAVSVVVLVTVGVELKQSGHPGGTAIALIVGTLALAWLFSNVIYALHYAHLYYRGKEGGPGDAGGIEFPGTKEPDYSAFIYFSFTLGMTFQTSDTNITGDGIRRVAIVHCFAAFVFNIGVLAFTINVLGGS